MVKPKRNRGPEPRTGPSTSSEECANASRDEGLAGAPQGKGQCPPRWAWLVCSLVALHVVAVLAEPFRFFSQSDLQAGPEFAMVRRFMAPYVEWLSLDHGYFFFAPNPGPSHLVAVRVVSPPPVIESSLTSGHDRPVALEEFAYLFPDRKRQWPRLLYHRYFMLSEFYNNSFAPSALLDEDRSDSELLQRWTRDRAFYERLGQSIAGSLAHSLGVERVELVRLERELFTPDQVLREGWRLDDPRGLMVLLESESSEEPPLLPAQPQLLPAQEVHAPTTTEIIAP